MKTINIGTNTIGISMSRSMVDLSDRQPCWYATLEDQSQRNKAKWIVGVKKADEVKKECSFEIFKIGDVSDDGFWAYVSSADFAVKLIEKYRNDGKPAITSWIKDGCPGFIKRGK